jgi:hypothetical protein
MSQRSNRTELLDGYDTTAVGIPSIPANRMSINREVLRTAIGSPQCRETSNGFGGVCCRCHSCNTSTGQGRIKAWSDRGVPGGEATEGGRTAAVSVGHCDRAGVARVDTIATIQRNYLFERCIGVHEMSSHPLNKGKTIVYMHSQRRREAHAGNPTLDINCESVGSLVHLQEFWSGL